MKILTAIVLTVPTLVLGQVERDPRWSAFQDGKRLEQAYRAAGMVNVQWSADSKAYGLMEGGRRVWRSVATGEEVTNVVAYSPPLTFQSVRGRPVDSPDKAWRLMTQGNRVYLKGEGDPIPLVPDSEITPTVLCGNVPWVYGEELGQNVGMGWSPSGNRFWFYRFDSKPVQTYYLANQLPIQSTLMELDYPKAGAPNHLVEVWVGDAASGQARRIDLAPRPGVEYLFDIRWISPTHLLMSRMDRLHQSRELAVYDSTKRELKSVYTEHDPRGFIPSSWRVVPSGDFIFFPADNNGFANFSRVNLKTNSLETLGVHPFDVGSLLAITSSGIIYTGGGGGNPLATQLYSYDFRSKKSSILTNPQLHHAVSVSPNGEYFFDVAQFTSLAPERALYRIEKGASKLVRQHDRPPVPMLPGPATEVVAFTSADGKTPLTGLISFPKAFDPAKRYPVLFDVYGGPERSDVELSYQPYRALTELGFLVVQCETRGGVGRGAAFRDAVYRNLGIAEIDDFAAFAKKLGGLPYVDRTRVAIFGTSYGGYASLMALLRYPDLFQAASAGSPPTDWRNYDTIYTERFMGLPQDQKAAYDAGNALTYVNQMKGRLQLYFGTSDDNVHPSNSLQLIRDLERHGKDYEIRIGPDRGHTYVGDRHLVRFLWNAFGM